VYTVGNNVESFNAVDSVAVDGNHHQQHHIAQRWKVNVHVFTCVSMYVCACTRACVCGRDCVCARMRARTCVCVCERMCTYVWHELVQCNLPPIRDGMPAWGE
jgi:hypothetical protein